MANKSNHVCPICLDPDKKESIIRVCACNMRYHQTCLQLKFQFFQGSSRQCEICRAKYQFSSQLKSFREILARLTPFIYISILSLITVLDSSEPKSVIFRGNFLIHYMSYYLIYVCLRESTQMNPQARSFHLGFLGMIGSQFSIYGLGVLVDPARYDHVFRPHGINIYYAGFFTLILYGILGASCIIFVGGFLWVLREMMIDLRDQIRLTFYKNTIIHRSSVS